MSLIEQVEILKKESARRIGSIATLVLVVSLAMLLIGVLWKEKFESSATILIQDEKIIEPLLSTTTVPTSGRDQQRWPVEKDRAEMAREVLFSHNVLNRAIEEAGWPVDEMTPIERGKLVDLVKLRLDVKNAGANVIEIAYRDPSPERAFRTVLALSELFITRARDAATRESRAAYEFISAETQRYREKLNEAERKLQVFYAENGHVRPGAGQSADARITELMRGLQDTSLDLEAARVRVRSLEAQLGGGGSGSAVAAQQDQLRSMIADLQSELATLRLQYHDTYPDIVTLKHKIETLRTQLANLESGEGGATIATADDVGIINPLHQEIRAELTDARTEVAALEERLARNRMLIEEERGRGVELSGVEAEAAELNREYEVTQALYQDLLQRRENARIAMNMAAEGEGMSMSIQEPPTVPEDPSGLRFAHFAAAGPLLGLALALGLVFLRVRFDDRIRSSSTISRELQIPVLATVPMLTDGRARARQRKVRATVVTAGVMLLACYALVVALRLNGAI